MCGCVCRGGALAWPHKKPWRCARPFPMWPCGWRRFSGNCGHPKPRFSRTAPAAAGRLPCHVLRQVTASTSRRTATPRCVPPAQGCWFRVQGGCRFRVQGGLRPPGGFSPPPCPGLRVSGLGSAATLKWACQPSVLARTHTRTAAPPPRPSWPARTHASSPPPPVPAAVAAAAPSPSRTTTLRGPSYCTACGTRLLGARTPCRSVRPQGFAFLAARRPANAAPVADVVTRTKSWRSSMGGWVAGWAGFWCWWCLRHVVVVQATGEQREHTHAGRFPMPSPSSTRLVLVVLRGAVCMYHSCCACRVFRCTIISLLLQPSPFLLVPPSLQRPPRAAASTRPAASTPTTPEACRKPAAAAGRLWRQAKRQAPPTATAATASRPPPRPRPLPPRHPTGRQQHRAAVAAAAATRRAPWAPPSAPAARRLRRTLRTWGCCCAWRRCR